jgi:hypothetical protein
VRLVEYPHVRVGVVDPAQLVRVSVGERGAGRHLSRAVCQLLRDEPQAAGYDHIWDMLQFDGDATHQDILRIQEVYLQVARPQRDLAYTCLVTLDHNMGLWAAAMDEQFPGRRHLVMRSLAQAEDWLRETRRRAPEPAGGQTV